MGEADSVFPHIPSYPTSPVVVLRDVNESSDEGTTDGLRGPKINRNRFVMPEYD